MHRVPLDPSETTAKRVNNFNACSDFQRQRHSQGDGWCFQSLPYENLKMSSYLSGMYMQQFVGRVLQCEGDYLKRSMDAESNGSCALSRH